MFFILIPSDCSKLPFLRETKVAHQVFTFQLLYLVQLFILWLVRVTIIIVGKTIKVLLVSFLLDLL